MASSCESGRRKVNSNDLCWRMIFQREMLGLSYEEVGLRLSVDPSTVWRAVRRFEELGTVDSSYSNDGPPKKLTSFDEFTIIEAVLDQPLLYLSEIQHSLANNRNKYFRIGNLPFSSSK